MNKVNFKCWSETIRTEGTGTRLQAIRSIFCHTADAKERAEIIESLQSIARTQFNEVHEVMGGGGGAGIKSHVSIGSGADVLLSGCNGAMGARNV